MAAPQGPGSEPVHTLYDEQGNEIPAEVFERVQGSDDDGSDQEVLLCAQQATTEVCNRALRE